MSSQLTTPSQVKVAQKSISSFFSKPKQSEICLTPSDDGSTIHSIVVTPATIDPSTHDSKTVCDVNNSTYDIDRLVSSQVDPSVGIADEKGSPVRAPSNVSTMPPLPPRVIVPKKRKATPKNDSKIEGEGEVGADLKETPKKRTYQKKVAAVTPCGEEIISNNSAMDVDDDNTAEIVAEESTAVPVKPVVKRVRKPAAKKVVAVIEEGSPVADTTAAEDTNDSALTTAVVENTEEKSNEGEEANEESVEKCVEEGGEEVTKPVAVVKKTKPKMNIGTVAARALKALESYNYTGSKEVMAEKRVSKTVDYTDSSSAMVDALLDGRTAKHSSSSSTADGVSELAPTASAVLEKAVRELSPEIQEKIFACKERIQPLLNELQGLENASDMRDQNIEVDLAIEDLVKVIIALPAPVAVTPPVTQTETTADGSAEVVVEADVATTIAEPVSAVAAAPVEEQDPNEVLADKLFVLLRVIEARAIQGSSLGKAALVQHIAAALATAIEKVNIACEAATGIAGDEALATCLDNVSDLTARGVVDRQQRFLATIQGLSATAELEKECDVLATRKHFGNPLNKPASAADCAEDTDIAAVWRWQVNYPLLYFTKAGNNIIREVNAVRTRYSKAIKAVVKMIEDLANESCTAAGLAASEDKVSKAMVDIEKAKEKRREFEVKRQAEAADKATKEAIKEAKRREKEENDLKKKQMAEAKAEAVALAKAATAAEKAIAAAERAAAAAEKEKKEKVPTEKEIKTAQQLEKQKNALKGFFVSKPASSSSSSSSSASSNAFAPLSTRLPPVASSSASSSSSSSSSSSCKALFRNQNVVCIDDEVTNDCIITSVATPTASENGNGDTSTEVVILTKKSRRLAEFERALAANMSMEDVQRAHRLHYRELRANKKNGKLQNKKRAPVKLYVTVNIPSTGGSSNAFSEANENNYSEIRERIVDSRIRTLSFAEDYRPAYVGTFSKKSSIITGRRPLAQDDSLFQYDEDSEGEWEEEAEGEDIADSGDEDEDGEGNELVYDDFFRRDNDYGSDAESDVEPGLNTAGAVNGREREEIVGPRFLNNSNITRYPLPAAGDAAASSSAVSVITSYRSECTAAADSSNSPATVSFTVCPERDADSLRLSQYATVLFTPANLMPYLGEQKKTATASSSSAGASSSGDAASSAKKEPKSSKKRKADAAVESVVDAAVDGSSSSGDAAAAAEAEAENKPGAFKGFDETKLSDLVQLIHGKKDGIDKLVIAFHADTAPHVSKLQIKKRILEVADKVKHVEGHGSQRWCVKKEIYDKLSAETPAPLEFTPAKKQKKRAELIKVSGPASSSSSSSSDSATPAAAVSITSVSSFINTFMPAELLVPITAKPAVTETAAAVPSTPKRDVKSAATSNNSKSSTASSSSGSACATTSQSNKITAFVKHMASPVKCHPILSSSSPLASAEGIAAMRSIHSSPVVSSSSASGSATKSPAVTTGSSDSSKAIPEVIELMDE